MEITIEDRQVPGYTHDIFDVGIYSHTVETLVTHIPFLVDEWIDDTERIHRRRLRHLIVGLDAEWRPCNSRFYNKVAILQLCVGHRCLIFQLLYAHSIPQSLVDFLQNADYSFVGVGIRNDIRKLEADHSLSVANPVDLGEMAAREYNDSSLRNAGLKNLARILLGMEIAKPKWITMGRWDKDLLDYDQVKYASVDAFVSFELGRRLL